MDFAANFTAIDFETANRSPDSACQLAAVRVRDGQIVDEAMWMIRPRPLRFSPQNIQIHGITPRAVRGESEFGEQWPDIRQTLGNDILVAHNAGFDMGVLLACLRTHNQPIPDFEFTCTRAIARKTWKHLPRFGLKPLATWLGIRFKHHDALEDSIACAKVLLAAGIDREANSVEDLEKQLRITRGVAGPWGHRAPRSSTRKTRKSAKQRPANGVQQSVLPFVFPDQVAEDRAEYRVSEPQSHSTDPNRSTDQLDLQRLLIRADFIRSLSGQRVVFSGRLRYLSNRDAELLATRLGGTCQSDVDDATNLLVLGEEESDPDANKSDALKIVSELEFLSGIVDLEA